VSISKDDVKPLFTEKTKAIVWGMQNKAVQGMLDFDHVCSRKEPSVVAMIYPFVLVFTFLPLSSQFQYI
jgi:ATP citrate (pro-S)-lyase